MQLPYAAAGQQASLWLPHAMVVAMERASIDRLLRSCEHTALLASQPLSLEALLKAYHDKKRAEQPCVPSPQLAVAMGHPCVPSAQDKGALGPPRALTGMATPQDGDRILVFRPRWLNLLLDEEKDLEIRGRNLSSGPCWLGCRGTIYGHCFLGSPIVIDSIEVWRGLRHRHRVEVDELPYKTTYGFPVHQCRRVTLTSYEHPRGAVGIVRFHRASSRHKGQRPPSGGA